MDKATILIAEDERDIRDVIKATLSHENYNVLEASSTRRLMEIIQSHHVNLILLDLLLSDGSTMGLIPSIRQHTQVPILILSGNGNDNVRVEGFEEGADDFIPKPFKPMELRARIKASLRRSYDFSVLTQKEAAPAKLRLGPLTLDPEEKRVCVGPGDLDCGLTVPEYRILEALMLAAEKTLSRQDLIAVSNGGESYPCTARAVDIRIARIRKKLSRLGVGHDLIKTVRGLGYKIDCETQGVL